MTSPIHIAMRDALVERLAITIDDMQEVQVRCDQHRRLVLSTPAHFVLPTLFEEVAFRSYRVDLLLALRPGDCFDPFDVLAIECDGFDFHERTKQQGSYDRARDAELLAAGIPTVRFLGSDIMYATDRCVAAVVACSRGWVTYKNSLSTPRTGVDAVRGLGVKERRETTKSKKREEHAAEQRARRDLALRIVHKEGAVSQARLAMELGLKSPRSVVDLLDSMVSGGVLEAAGRRGYVLKAEPGISNSGGSPSPGESVRG